MAVPFSRNGASLPALTEGVRNLSQTVGVGDHFLCFYSLSLREARKERARKAERYVTFQGEKNRCILHGRDRIHPSGRKRVYCQKQVQLGFAIWEQVNIQPASQPIEC